MKSTSFDLKVTPSQNDKVNKTYDFVSLYKTAEDTNAKLQEKRKSIHNLNGENVSKSAGNSDTRKREQSPNKKRKKIKNETLDISVINIDSSSLGAKAPRSSPVKSTRVTSTPVHNKKSELAPPKVRSIMKNSSLRAEDTMDSPAATTPTSKSKKRNKSVSFMLDDTEEVVVKKAKSEESLDNSQQKSKSKSRNKYEEKKKLKKVKKSTQAEKENNANINMETDQGDKQKDVPDKKVKSKDKSKPILSEATGDSPASDGPLNNPEKKKKFKKVKNPKKTEEGSEPTENETNNNDVTEHKAKKLKKKKRHSKTVPPPDTTDAEGEPATKSRKKDVKPEVIAEDLENLSIGDNAHTLTNLLDDMTVVDKNKKRKNKLRRKKDKTTSVSSSETADLEKIEEGKEKVKWKKRKWNKDKKGCVDEDYLGTTLIVEKLPLKLMLHYKTLLAHHFGGPGLIKKIGIAEVYPTEESKPVFTTTITFNSEAASIKALEEDNTELEGSRIRVKRPLPPTQTTLVVRSYGELSEQSLSSAFTNAGRIRNIRNLLKGRKSMATAFIEFDGPEAVEKAIKMAEDARIGGKKLHVCKFEFRGGRRSEKKKQPESENEGDSENSND